MTEVTAEAVRLTRTIKADRERVFRTWTDPAEMKRWAGPEGYKIPNVEVDLRVGGSYRIRMVNPEGQTYNVVGVYHEITSPTKLVYTWQWQEPEHDVGETLVTVEFKDVGGATEIVLVHERMPNEEARNGHEQGWTSCLNRFEGLF